MHDIDKIVSSCCAETERPKKMSPWQYRSRDQPRRLEAHQEQYIDRVVDAPAEREPGDGIMLHKVLQ